MTPMLLTSLLLTSTSFMFTRMQHPLAMGLTLISQTLLICISSGMMSSFMWLSYILFLVFLGATLVLFIYIASLASNEMFTFSPLLSMTLLIPLILGPALLVKDEFTCPIKPMTEFSSLKDLEITEQPTFSLSMIYNLPSSALTSYIILYLLLTLIIIVKMTSSYYGPLRLS